MKRFCMRLSNAFLRESGCLRPGEAQFPKQRKIRFLYRNNTARRLGQRAKAYPLLFGSDEELLMDPSAIRNCRDGVRISWISTTPPRVIHLATFTKRLSGGLMRLSEGQFFTPLNAVDWLVSAVDPKAGEVVLDPACGAGGFLSLTVRPDGLHKA